MDVDVASVNKVKTNNSLNHPQCQFFVIRKKRLCRMTVRPGRNYCGEHEPEPKPEMSPDDTRIPCPYDPKHTCYASKLKKHLSICNARQLEQPDYIVHNINVQQSSGSPRVLLSQVPEEKIRALIDKVNILYDKYVKDTITVIDEQPIHEVVLEEFNEERRAESSLRHLRQVSSLLHLMEAEGLVQDNTCYVELGAGKGQFSYYAYKAWCGKNASRVLLVDRASLRHKLDNKLRDSAAATDSDAAGSGASGCCRIRADLAHLALDKVPEVLESGSVVGFAKHLCGVATDYALRCLMATGAARRLRGAALATCCHHRCDADSYVGTEYMQELGINSEELNIMFGIVSWATCGDGRSRERRQREGGAGEPGDAGDAANAGDISNARFVCGAGRAAAGLRAKALLDAGRARFLQSGGLRTRLCRFVPPAVSPENLCILAVRPDPL
ncbi:tRNA:m(4)X modification enzyme TRM13 homolog [Epargyreus clarus]|uniref:tRNA:m(4)X modification enzyme TRM13 homolog n=1 Tax=Epargyreus clarus TaxID=520877 RepID=UPI003C2D95B4